MIPLTNGGLGGAIFVFLGTSIGMGFVITSMAEMASMYVLKCHCHITLTCIVRPDMLRIRYRAPTSGGQYHWVSEFAPKKHQKFLSYVVGKPDRYTVISGF
jgi:choline transport protein